MSVSKKMSIIHNKKINTNNPCIKENEYYTQQIMSVSKKSKYCKYITV
jgi:hypothetical protein